jgi:streptomycin 6-kinase
MDHEVQRRIEHHVRAWNVRIDETHETAQSAFVMGTRNGDPVVIKIAKHRNDEWRAGDTLQRFGGRGVIQVLESTEGATLLPRLEPGTSLVRVCHKDDEQATRILAEVIRELSPAPHPDGIPFVQDWTASFDRYLRGSNTTISCDLVAEAHRVYLDLCATQRDVRLLHGDLHHDNVLHDSTRGWVAVDPKGVVGELAFEVGAALRNPIELPELFTDPRVIDARVRRFSGELTLDRSRVVAWASTQAVLAAIWLIEDGEPVQPDHPWLTLAQSLRRL